MRLWILLLVLLVPSVSLAGWGLCNGQVNNNTGDGIVTPATLPICLRQSTAADPTRVNATACKGGVTALWNADVLGGTVTATAYPYVCSTTGAQGSFTDCEKLIVDRDGNGTLDDLPMNGDPTAGRAGTYRMAPTWLTFDVTNGGSNTVELMVVCQ